MDQSQHSFENHAGHDLHGNLHHVPKDASSVLTTTIAPTGMPTSSINLHHQHHHVTTGAEQTTTTMNTMIHHMMSMAFHFGYNETILFDWWKIDSVGGLIGSMAIIFIFAVLYEGLKYYREFLLWKTYNLLEYRPVLGHRTNPESGQVAVAPQSSNSSAQYVGEVIHKQPPTMLSRNHLIQTILHMIQVTVSFLLMLIFMTYNVWLCLAVVLGAAVGYFLFCWKKSLIVDVSENCH